ncbi:MAG: S8 family peptidase [Bacteroidetes bacterium]|nr:S8 family peptidase [Bacteroidota bacterium]
MKQIVTTVLFFLVIMGFSQIPQKYFVAFTDKNGTPYSINNPQAFLTQRAIDRRAAQGIAVVEEDLPVNPAYVNAVAATGVQVFTVSKWFNGVTIRVVDTAVLASIRALPYVQNILRVSSYNSKKSTVGDWKFRQEEGLNASGGKNGSKSPNTPTSYDYGPSYNQIHMLNGDVLHNLGYRGQGKVIAVLDAGFLDADNNATFDSLRAFSQILGTRDFVNPGGNVYLEHYHGAAVLSTMGGNTPGELIGTAPKASYWLIRTEDANTENIVEEYNWVVGAEMADSVGADIINSSLGYTLFDNDWMDHSFADMNGHTTPSARGANIAASKGMALSISAGNEGGSAWITISAPSDALDALSIGAVDEFGNYASFSSAGTVNGGFVKPNIATQGMNCYVGYPGGSFGYGSGTSFASPINAGMMACLWQAKPNFNQSVLRMVIQQSASQFTHPDSLLGYGIPDYSYALLLTSAGTRGKSSCMAYPNPFTDAFKISFDGNTTGTAEITLFSLTGDIVLRTNRLVNTEAGDSITINDLVNLAPGMYIIRITSGNNTEYLHLVKVAK